MTNLQSTTSTGTVALLAPPAARVIVILAAGMIGAFPTNAHAGPLELSAAPTLAWTTTGIALAVERESRTFSSEVAEVRARSGLTWQQLATLFHVDRRSVHLWASGRPPSDEHGAFLTRLLEFIRRVDRGEPSATRAWLGRPMASGELPLDLLREARFNDVPLPPPILPRPRPAPLSEAARAARAPLPPDVLVGALQDAVVVQKGGPVSSVPLKSFRRR